MSTTVASLRARVLSKLHMLDERTGPSRVYVDQEIRDQYLAMQARLPDAYSYTAAAGSITAGSATFTLPSTSSAEYGETFGSSSSPTTRS